MCRIAVMLTARLTNAAALEASSAFLICRARVEFFPLRGRLDRIRLGREERAGGQCDECKEENFHAGRIAWQHIAQDDDYLALRLQLVHAFLRIVVRSN
jgi:hypothetical protein